MISVSPGTVAYGNIWVVWDNIGTLTLTLTLTKPNPNLVSSVRYHARGVMFFALCFKYEG